MNVELSCVGTELLLGNILNTNAKYISEKCAELGLSMFYQTVVGDNPDRLKDTLLTALGRSDVIITSGGLGPTNDDLTKEILEEKGFEVDEAGFKEKMEIQRVTARNARKKSNRR